MNEERRGSWYLLTGIILGVALGLVYSWMIAPVEYVDAPPSALRQDFQDQYRALVAAAFMYSGDLARAQSRLEQLEDPDIARTLAMQAQRALAEGHPDAEIRALGVLAMALGQGSTPIVTSLPTTPSPATAVATDTGITTTLQTSPVFTPTLTASPTRTPVSTLRTPQPTNTPLPSSTPTPTPTQGAPFILQDMQTVCNPNLPEPLIQVLVNDAAGQPVPGVEIVITWDAGEEHFFTGLKPELSLGYADVAITPGVIYILRLAEGGQLVADLTAPECQAADGSLYWGSLLLIFVQP